MDADFVASCAPGVESVEATDPTHFEVLARLGVGSVALRFTLHVELSDLHPPTHARMMVKGDAPGSATRANCGATLVSLAAHSTRLDWTLAADLHGTIASVGARLLGGTVGRIARAFWKTFATRAGRGGTAAAPREPKRRAKKRPG